MSESYPENGSISLTELDIRLGIILEEIDEAQAQVDAYIAEADRLLGVEFGV